MDIFILKFFIYILYKKRVSSLTKINFENEKSPNNNNFNNNNVLISSKDQKAILKNKLLS